MGGKCAAGEVVVSRRGAGAGVERGASEVVRGEQRLAVGDWLLAISLPPGELAGERCIRQYYVQMFMLYWF